MRQPKSKRPAPTNVRTRYEPPTPEEAVFAAQGLSDHVEQQIELAAELMGLSEAEIEPHVRQAAAPAPALRAPDRVASGRPAVAIERRSSRSAIPSSRR
jgi:hypothetical protein